jgi:hypothetical protein
VEEEQNIDFLKIQPKIFMVGGKPKVKTIR